MSRYQNGSSRLLSRTHDAIIVGIRVQLFVVENLNGVCGARDTYALHSQTDAFVRTTDSSGVQQRLRG